MRDEISEMSGPFRWWYPVFLTWQRVFQDRFTICDFPVCKVHGQLATRSEGRNCKWPLCHSCQREGGPMLACIHKFPEPRLRARVVHCKIERATSRNVDSS